MEIVECLVYFMDIQDILRALGTFCVNLVHFSQFWYHVPRKIWQPWPGGVHVLKKSTFTAQLCKYRDECQNFRSYKF
jgi:hypothetical protein